MDLRVSGLEDLEDRVGDALERIGELQAGTRVQSDAFFSEPFMRQHTEFDSWEEMKTGAAEEEIIDQMVSF